MKKIEVVEFFGSRIAAADALGITPQAITMWGDDVPRTRVRTVELAMMAEQGRRDAEAKKEERRKARRAKQEA